MTTVSFIVPLYNCLPLTQAMLASLRATLPPGLEHEILFVDDGSRDGTREWLATLASPCRAILNEKNLGFAGACNRGAAAAAGELLFFLNNDLVLLPGWFEPMQAAFARYPAAGVVGNVQVSVATGAVDHAGIFFNHQGKPAHATALPLAHALPGASGYRAVAAVTGACFALRRGDWETFGGFDPGFVNGGEDVDLCLRASAAGRVNYVALRSRVRHHVSQSAGRKLRDEHNTFRLVERWHATIVQLAARAWSRQQIVAHADRSHVFDYAGVQAALGHYLFRTAPPRSVLAGVTASIEVERQRWRELLEGAAPPAPPPATRTDLI